MLDLEVAGAVRELGDGDQVPAAQPHRVKRLYDSHHGLAKAVARGLSAIEASAATGYSIGRIATLKEDPCFQELVAFYRADNEKVARDVEALFLNVGYDALQLLHEELQDCPAEFAPSLKLELVKAMFDRAGFSPIARTLNKNYNVHIGDRLDQLNGRGRKDEAA